MSWDEQKKEALKKAKKLEKTDIDIESIEQLKEDDKEFQHEAAELKGMLTEKNKKEKKD